MTEWLSQHVGALVTGLALSALCASPVRAQAAAASNPGAITLTGNFDVPSVWIFRGIVQELNPKITMFPSVDVGVNLSSGDGAIRNARIHLGSWHSLQTGDAGSGGPTARLHYQENFYASFGVGLGALLRVEPTFTAYTSPNNMFNTVRELSVKVSGTRWFNPYGIVAYELDGQADRGSNSGTYLELGAGPTWPLAGGRATLTVPVRIGISLKDYYEGFNGDSKFGFLDVGGQISVPLSKTRGRFGSWNIHGGVDVYAFGDTTKSFDAGKGSKVVGLGGIGVTY